MDYVIIGNSAAAIGCVEGIRSVDKEGKITLLSQERFHTYSRPLISYLLENKTDLQHMTYRPTSFYRDMAVEAHLGVKATEIRPQERPVRRCLTINFWWPQALCPLSPRSRAWTLWSTSSPSSPWMTPKLWNPP